MDQHWKQTKPCWPKPSALLAASPAPDKHTFVLAPGELVIADNDARMMAKLVKELLDGDEGMGGTPDKRHTSLKTQCGYKSSCAGYATGEDTRWLHSIYNGTAVERAASKEELLNPAIAAANAGPNMMGRPPLPEVRAGHDLLMRNPTLKDFITRKAAAFVKAKRAMHPEGAREDESCTQPVLFSDGGVETKTLSSELLDGLTPGISGLTMNWDVLRAAGPGESRLPPAWTQLSDQAWQVTTAFPPDSEGNGDAHRDDLDKHGLAHLGMSAPSLGYLGLYQFDPHGIIKGGHFFMRLSPTVSLAVQPACAPPVLSTFCNHWHIAGKAYKDPTRSVEELEGAFAPHVVQTRGIQKRRGRDAPGTTREYHSRILAVRGSIVMQLSRLVARSMHLMRRPGFSGIALASNSAQKEWLVRRGLIPLSDNEQTREKHKNLRMVVGEFPINRRGVCTAEEMQPYTEEADARWHEYEMLASI